MCNSASERNCGTWGVGWLHFSILALPSFSSTFCKEVWTLCIERCFLNLTFTFFFKHFLPGIIGLRCRMVTFFNLSFTFFFEHFLQGTMDLRHRLITSPQRHLTNSLQTACGHLTIFTFPPLSVESGGDAEGVTGWRISSGLSTPPKVNLPRHGFWRRRGQKKTYSLPHREKIRRGQNCCLHFLNVPHAYTHEKGGDYYYIWRQWSMRSSLFDCTPKAHFGPDH